MASPIYSGQIETAPAGQDISSLGDSPVFSGLILAVALALVVIIGLTQRTRIAERIAPRGWLNTWKKEHRTALALAAALGAAAGLAGGFHELRPDAGKWGPLWCQRPDPCIFLVNFYWLRLALCASAGAIVGSTIVWIRRLLQA